MNEKPMWTLTRAVGDSAKRMAAALLFGRSAGDIVKSVWSEAAVSIGGLCAKW